MNPIRTWFHVHRWNPYHWIARIERVVKYQSDDIKDIDRRLRRLETMLFGYGPPPKPTNDPCYDTDRKDC